MSANPEWTGTGGAEGGRLGCADRATHEPNPQAVSALRVSVPDALFAHYHHGWRKHELPGGEDEHLLAALLERYAFLAEYKGRYRVEIKRTPERSYDGKVAVYWDSDEPKTFAFGGPLWKGDHWFTAFEFNVAPADACRYCGGTGIDHYNPFSHCWACDGTARQMRQSTPRGFMKKPIAACAEATHRKYAEWLAASAIEAGTGEAGTGSTAEGGESAVPKGDAQ